MKNGLIPVIAGVIFSTLTGCASPSREFAGADRQELVVGTHEITVFVLPDRAQAIRTSFAGKREKGDAIAAMAVAIEQASGKKLSHPLVGDGILHLINSGPAALDGTGEQTDADGNPTMKPFWDISDEEVDKCLKATTWHPSITEYFPGGGWSTRYRTRGGMPATMIRLNLVDGLGPALQIAEGHTIDLPDDVHDSLDQRTNPTWPTTW